MESVKPCYSDLPTNEQEILDAYRDEEKQRLIDYILDKVLSTPKEKQQEFILELLLELDRMKMT